MNSFILHSHTYPHECSFDDSSQSQKVAAMQPKSCIILSPSKQCVIQKQSLAHLFKTHNKESKPLPFLIGYIPGHKKHSWYEGVALIRWLKQNYTHPVLGTPIETVVFYRYSSGDKAKKQYHFQEVAACKSLDAFVKKSKELFCFDPENVGARIRWAHRLYTNGKIKTAAAWIQRILTEPVKSAEYHKYLSLIRLLLQHDEQKNLGLKLFDKIWNEPTDDASLMAARAAILAKGDVELGIEQQPENAKELLVAALHKDPSLISAAHNLVDLLYSEGKESEEIAKFLFSILYIEGSSNNLCIFIEDLRLARYGDTAHTELASLLCNMGLAIEPENQMMLTSLAAIFATDSPGAQSQPEKAREIFEKILSSNPDHPFALLHLGELYRNGTLAEGKNFALAHEFFTRALERSHNNVFEMHACACLGWILQKGGYGIEKNYIEAKLHFERALDLDNEYIFALESLAELLLEGGEGIEPNLQEAKLHFKRVLELEPDSAFSLLGLAKIYAKNEPKKAFQYVERALSLFDEDAQEQKEECRQLIMQIQD